MTTPIHECKPIAAMLKTNEPRMYTSSFVRYVRCGRWSEMTSLNAWETSSTTKSSCSRQHRSAGLVAHTKPPTIVMLKTIRSML